jgi:hypothetical protein
VVFIGQSSNADMVGKNHVALQNSSPSAGIPSSKVNFFPPCIRSFTKLYPVSLPEGGMTVTCNESLHSPISPYNNKK